MTNQSLTTHSLNMNKALTKHEDDTNTQSPLNIAIIGAGLTGLITADLLEQAFQQQNQPVTITIFEKSAGVGRLATRYKKPDANDALSSASAEPTESTENKQPINNAKQWQFDFGAQFFTAKTAAFQTYLQPWLEDGTIEPWQATLATVDAKNMVAKNMDANNNNIDAAQIKPAGQWGLAQPRYISSPKMTTWGRSLAKKLSHTTIHYKTRVAPLEKATVAKAANQNVKTALVDVDNNELGVFDWVICTAPLAQAIEMIANTDFTYQEALSTDELGNLPNIPNMLACYTLMLGWRQNQDMPEVLKQAEWSVLDVANNDAELACLGKLFIEHKKPSRDDILPSVTIHADNDWSQAHVDDDIETVQTQLLAVAKSILKWNEATAPIHIDCHRWRYAATEQHFNPSPQISHQSHQQKQHSTAHCESSGKLVYFDTKNRWVITGDWCDEGRIESCYKVATEVVRLISRRQSLNSVFSF